MPGEKDDLADMVGVVSDLAVDGLQNGVWFGADEDGAREVGICERFERGEKTLPTGVPHG